MVTLTINGRTGTVPAAPERCRARERGCMPGLCATGSMDPRGSFRPWPVGIDAMPGTPASRGAPVQTAIVVSAWARAGEAGNYPLVCSAGTDRVRQRRATDIA